jgi:hypothetical protein
MPTFLCRRRGSQGNADLDTYLQQVKSDTVFTEKFTPWERDYTDPAKLVGWSLGELGSRLEFTIHNQMHMRWCAEPAATGIRPDTNVTHPDSIDPEWDDPKYDWLGDTYSSHVNAMFWKVHGWVDNRIEDWKAAHQITGDIAWQGKWVGKTPAQPEPHSFLSALMTYTEMAHQGHSHGSLPEMENVLKLVLHTGQRCHFYDDVVLP